MNGSSPAASQEDQILIEVQELMAANPGMSQDEAIQIVLGSRPDSDFRQPKPPAPPEELDGGLVGAPSGDIGIDPSLMGQDREIDLGPTYATEEDARLENALEIQANRQANADLKMQDRMNVLGDAEQRSREEAEALGMIEPGGFKQEEVQIPSPTPDEPDRTTPVTRVTGGEQQFHGQDARELAESQQFGYQYIQLDPMTGQPVLDENGNPIPLTRELAKKQQIESVAAYDFVPVLGRDGNITYINPTLMANRPETDESMGEMSPSQMRSLTTQQNRIRDRMGVSDEDATFTPYRRRDGSIGNRIDPNSKAVRGKRQAAVDEKQKRQNLVTMRAMMSPRDRGGNFVVPQSQINAQALLMGVDMPAAMPQLSDMDEETRRGLLYQTFPNLARVDTAAGEQAQRLLLERLGAMSQSLFVNPLDRELAEQQQREREVKNNPLAVGEQDIANGDLNTAPALKFREEKYDSLNRSWTSIGLSAEEQEEYRAYYIGLGVPPAEVEQMLQEDERKHSMMGLGGIRNPPGGAGGTGGTGGTKPPTSGAPQGGRRGGKGKGP